MKIKFYVYFLHKEQWEESHFNLGSKWKTDFNLSVH